MAHDITNLVRQLAEITPKWVIYDANFHRIQGRTDEVEFEIFLDKFLFRPVVQVKKELPEKFNTDQLQRLVKWLYETEFVIHHLDYQNGVVIANAGMWLIEIHWYYRIKVMHTALKSALSMLNEIEKVLKEA